MFRKFNTRYTVKDGNWFDKNIWRGNGCKKYTYPQPGDDVHIDHDITFDYTNNPNAPSISRSSIVGNTIHNLYISKNGAYRTTNLGNQVTIFITGNVQCDGVFDLSNGSSGVVS
ncbi:hypothetical protein HK413_04605 [Mucilaginibacter sp. S1162]|uniref:Uncharacterized protein n=1 Tax=Mucilaginibacter humi TaxID=2732510 RepID=A0ABX1W0H3_9SPHI|nr:hypothetical protein [Mucilaginibacter humi]NNU33610.1 hypothetical protein [Mucilaginibacter humi]